MPRPRDDRRLVVPLDLTDDSMRRDPAYHTPLCLDRGYPTGFDAGWNGARARVLDFFTENVDVVVLRFLWKSWTLGDFAWLFDLILEGEYDADV